MDYPERLKLAIDLRDEIDTWVETEEEYLDGEAPSWLAFEGSELQVHIKFEYLDDLAHFREKLRAIVLFLDAEDRDLREELQLRIQFDNDFKLAIDLLEGLQTALNDFDEFVETVGGDTAGELEMLTSQNWGIEEIVRSSDLDSPSHLGKQGRLVVDVAAALEILIDFASDDPSFSETDRTQLRNMGNNLNGAFNSVPFDGSELQIAIGLESSRQIEALIEYGFVEQLGVFQDRAKKINSEEEIALQYRQFVLHISLACEQEELLATLTAFASTIRVVETFGSICEQFGAEEPKIDLRLAVEEGSTLKNEKIVVMQIPGSIAVELYLSTEALEDPDLLKAELFGWVLGGTRPSSSLGTLGAQVPSVSPQVLQGLSDWSQRRTL